MRTVYLVVIATTFLTLHASRLMASWAAVPMEILVDEADVIVRGKVLAIEKSDLKLNERAYDLAVVEVAESFKNTTGMMKLMQVRIAQPAVGGLAVSTDIRFREGQDGIWILNKDADRDVYFVSHPFQVQETKEKDKLVKLIAARNKVTGGEPVAGLVARAEVIETHTVDGQVATFYEIRLSLKNTTDTPITICDFMGNKPVTVDWESPEGAAQSQHYDYLATVRLAGMTKHNYVTLPPNGIRYLGPRGKYYGVAFATVERPGTNRVGPGKHTIVVGYQNTEEGKGLVDNPAWTGEVQANPVEITVK